MPDRDLSDTTVSRQEGRTLVNEQLHRGVMPSLVRVRSGLHLIVSSHRGKASGAYLRLPSTMIEASKRRLGVIIRGAWSVPRDVKRYPV